MRNYKNMKQAVQSLSISHDTIPTKMLIKAVKNTLFKKPMEEEHYSHEWLRLKLYTEQNIIVFKKLLQIFPTDHDFTISGVEGEFLKG